MNKRPIYIVILVTITLVLSGCEQDSTPIEQIRSIKTMTVSELADNSTRKFSGIVMATDYSQLSFEVAGNVLAVNVDIGEKVTKGQKLAILNPKDFKLNLKAAEADLIKAKADKAHKLIEYNRELSIYDQGAGSQRQVDRAKYHYNAAQAAVEYTQAKVNLSKHELTKTILTAPYNGQIALRMVEPYMEVKTGETVIRIDAEGAMEVQLGVPETVVNFLDVGSSAKITFASTSAQILTGKISYLGSAAGDDNLFPVKVAMSSRPKLIAPGMTAEVTLELNHHAHQQGYLIPPIAITPIVNKAQEGFVFVYQAQTATVKKTPVKLSGGQKNLGIVYQGINPGDILAIAGVSFLADGMKVKLMTDNNTSLAKDK